MPKQMHKTSNKKLEPKLNGLLPTRHMTPQRGMHTRNVSKIEQRPKDLMHIRGHELILHVQHLSKKRGDSIWW